MSQSAQRWGCSESSARDGADGSWVTAAEAYLVSVPLALEASTPLQVTAASFLLR